MIKYEFHFRPIKSLTQSERKILTFEMRALSGLVNGTVCETKVLKGEWSGIVLMLARHEGRLVGYSYSGIFDSTIVTCAHPAYDDEELINRLPASLKLSRKLRLMWRRVKIPAALSPSRLLT